MLPIEKESGMPDTYDAIAMPVVQTRPAGRMHDVGAGHARRSMSLAVYQGRALDWLEPIGAAWVTNILDMSEYCRKETGFKNILERKDGGTDL